MIQLVSIQVGRPRNHGADPAFPSGGPWTSGIFKEPVPGAVHLGLTNLDGDAQADRKVHGGPDKAVLAYAGGHYPLWRSELGKPEISCGGFGENFTLLGTDERTVALGDVYEIGEALVQVSQPRSPCWKLAWRWSLPSLPARVVETGRSGWYFRVLREGKAAPGEMRLLERPCAEWTVARVTGIAYDLSHHLEEAARLADCRHLSDDWRLWIRRKLGLR